MVKESERLVAAEAPAGMEAVKRYRLQHFETEIRMVSPEPGTRR